MNKLIAVLVFVVSSLFSVASLAEPQTTLPPVKSGDTLWKLAEKNLPNKSISIEQFAYALYASNQAAFQAGDINQLSKGATLTIPPNDVIARTSKEEAKKQVDALLSRAKKLSIAKSNTKRFIRQIGKYKKQLRRYRKNSRRWRNVYRKLTRARRNYALSKKKETHFSKLMQEKPQPVTTNYSEAEIAKTNQILEKLENKKEDNPAQTLTKEQESKKESPKTESKSTRELAPEPKPVTRPVIAKTPTSAQINQNQVVARKSAKQAPTPPAISQASLQTKTETTNTKDTSWLDYLSNNLILFGGILNGLILLFVLFKLFEKKDDNELLT